MPGAAGRHQDWRPALCLDFAFPVTPQSSSIRPRATDDGRFCPDEARHLERAPEPDVPRAVLGVSSAIVVRAESAPRSSNDKVELTIAAHMSDIQASA